MKKTLKSFWRSYFFSSCDLSNIFTVQSSGRWRRIGVIRGLPSKHNTHRVHFETFFERTSRFQISKSLNLLYNRCRSLQKHEFCENITTINIMASLPINWRNLIFKKRLWRTIWHKLAHLFELISNTCLPASNRADSLKLFNMLQMLISIFSTDFNTRLLAHTKLYVCMYVANGAQLQLQQVSLREVGLKAKFVASLWVL